MVGEDPLCNLEGEPAPRKVREWIRCIWTIRIHEPCGLRGVTRNCVVVNDPDQDPKIQGLSNPRTICRPAVHGQNQLYAVLLCSSKRTLWNAMAIAFAVWDVALGNRADRAQRTNHDRRPRQAVRIKVTNDENGLPCFTSSSQARDQACCIRQELWSVQRSIAGIKKALHSIWGKRASRCEEFG
jgi:hypothetical protein